MVSPPPVFGYYMFRVFRATAYDIPEDFFFRVESGLDAAAKASVARGLRVMRAVRPVDRVITVALLAGAGILLVGPALLQRLGGWSPGTGTAVVGAGIASWLVAVASFVLVNAMYLVRRDDVRRVMTLYRALQGSSLARDLA